MKDPMRCAHAPRAALAALALLQIWILAGPAPAQECGDSIGLVPLIDLGPQTYQGFEGGLYPGGVNQPPAGHLQEAINRAQAIGPRDAAGNPDPCGLTGFLTVGASTMAHLSGMFIQRTDADTNRDGRVVAVNGALGGSIATAIVIQSPTAPYWSKLDEITTSAGLTNAQVQAVWMWVPYKTVGGHVITFPASSLLVRDALIEVVRNLRAKYPNLSLIYVSSHTYGNYDLVEVEPGAYENGFSVKWLIEEQLLGNPLLNYDPGRGPVEAPLLLWGSYHWADGVVPNGQGLSWCACDFEFCADNHLAFDGELKASNLMQNFLSTDPAAAPWYLAQGPGAIAVRAEADATVDAAAPDTNFGSATALAARAGTEPAHALLRFDVSGIQRPVRHAKLSFRNQDEVIGSVAVVSDSLWDESTVTWSNGPAVTGTATSMPQSTKDGTTSFDVTDALNQDPDGLVTFAVQADPASTGTKQVYARESLQAAYLSLVEGPGIGAAQPYCTAGTSAAGCSAQLSATGAASATAPSGFALNATGVEGAKDGLFFYSQNGRQANTWGSSTSFQCVTPPVIRAGLLTGTGSTGLCDGSFTQDFNALWSSIPAKNPGPGTIVQAQLWYRDPQNTSNQTTSLSDALEFCIGP